MKKKILFVCMGNICRSPTAEGVMRKLVRDAGLGHLIEVDSAGTHGYHVGEPPDPRAQRAAANRGYDLTDLRARKIAPNDLDYFDLILAMDQNNLDVLYRYANSHNRDKVHLLMEYSSNSTKKDIPDPFYSLTQGFDLVLDMIEEACQSVLAILKQQLDITNESNSSNINIK